MQMRLENQKIDQMVLLTIFEAKIITIEAKQKAMKIYLSFITFVKVIAKILNLSPKSMITCGGHSQPES